MQALFDLIPGPHIDCWRKFVQACRLSHASIISREQIEEVYELLLQFCENVQSLYGMLSR